MEIRVEQLENDEATVTFHSMGEQVIEVFLRRNLLLMDGKKRWDLSVYGDGSKITVVTIPEGKLIDPR